MSVRVLGALAAMPVWVLISVVVSALQLGLVIYNAMRIALDLAFFWLAGVLRSVAVWLGSPWSFTSYRRRVAAMERELHACDTHAKWLSAAERLDELEGHDTWRREVGEGLFDWRLVGATLSKLRQARKAGDTQELMFLLGSALHRRFGSIDRSALCEPASRPRASRPRRPPRPAPRCSRNNCRISRRRRPLRPRGDQADGRAIRERVCRRRQGNRGRPGGPARRRQAD